VALFGKLRQWLDRPTIARAEAEQKMTAGERHDVEAGLAGFENDVRAEGQLKPFLEHLEDEEQ
jgi:hypothetical protein